MFLKVFNDCVATIKKNKILIKQIELIALLGSVRENEAILNYSDLDILIILKSNKYGTFNKSVTPNLKRIASKFSKKSTIKISFLTHTFDDFKNYVDVEYLAHYSWGNVVYSKGKFLKKEIDEIIKNRGGLKKKATQSLMLYNLRHARFNVLREYISLNDDVIPNYDRSFAQKIVDKIFEISDWVLIYDGIWSKNKHEIVVNINKLYKNKLNTEALDAAYLMRKNWNEVSDSKLKNLMQDIIDYIINIIELTIKRSLKE